MGANITVALRSLNRAIPKGVAIVLGFFAFIVVTQTAVSSQIGGGWPAAIMLFVAFFALWAPAVLVHELGHAVAAELVGWRTWVFCVGPIVLKFRPQLSVQWGRLVERDAGGYILATPRSANANTKLREILVSLGGPLASLAVPLLAYPPATTLSEQDYVGASLVTALFFAFSATSLACAFVTAWPFQEKDGRSNDAAQIVAMMRSRHFKGRHPMAYAIALEQHGFRTHDFDGWIKVALERTETIRTTVSERFLAALVDQDHERAATTLEGYEGGEIEIMQAYLDAYARNTTADAETCLVTPGAGWSFDWKTGRWLRELTLVAILAAAKEFDAARARLKQLEHRR